MHAPQRGQALPRHHIAACVSVNRAPEAGSPPDTTITRIKTDDGCYEVHAINDQGHRYEGKFDPGTLNALKVEIKSK